MKNDYPQKRRFNSARRTADLKDAHYSKELIREYEDPEFARAAEEYEREARRQKAKKDRNGDRYADRYAGGGHEATRAARASRSKAGSAEKAARAAKADGTGKTYRFRPKKLVRNILIVLVILALVVGGGIYAFLYSLTDKLAPTFIPEDAMGIDPGVSDQLSDWRSIVILGSDARADEPLEGSRTDSIIVMSINKKTGETRMASIMRDAYLQIQYNDGSLFLDKITHAFHYGGAVDTLSSLNRNLDLNIREYVLFNWKAVADSVDCVDGVEINVKEEEIEDLNKYGPGTAKNVGGKYKKIKKPGKQTLDGVQAVTYCRIRKTSGGDVMRGNRTKIVIEAVLKKVMSSPGKLGKLTDTVLPQIETNVDRGQLISLLLLARKMDMKESVSWPEDYYGGLVGGLWYAVPTTLAEGVTALHQAMFGQAGYVPSGTCQSISDGIINKTGYQ